LKPGLEQSEGAGYFLNKARETTLGGYRAIEIPMLGSERYQSMLWLVQFGDEVLLVSAQISDVEPIVRAILASLAPIEPPRVHRRLG
jgi:hypothetical protein